MPPVLVTAAGTVLVAFALFLIGLAALTFARPAASARFLGAFAQTPRAHYTEQAIRLVMGTALIVRAPCMTFPGPFALLGWIILVTSLALLLLPWRWHKRFADRVVPTVIRYQRLYGVALAVFSAALILGLLID